MRRCFGEIKQGEVDAIRGYPVTRLDIADEYTRIDWCIAGFRGLIDRLCAEIDTRALLSVEKKLASGVAMEVSEIDAALVVLKRCEDALLRHSIAVVKDAVLTEQVAIELDRMK